MNTGSTNLHVDFFPYAFCFPVSSEVINHQAWILVCRIGNLYTA